MMRKTNEIIPARITLFGRVGLCDANGSYVKLGTGASTILLCLIVHYVVTGEAQLSRRDIMQSIFRDYQNVHRDIFENRFGVACTELRQALGNTSHKQLPFDRGTEMLALRGLELTIDAQEFKNAYKAAVTAQNAEQQRSERIELLETAVNNSQGSLDDLGIEEDRLCTEFEQLRFWQFDACYQLAVCYADQGQSRHALEFANQAMRIAPHNTDARKLESQIHATIAASAIQAKPKDNLPCRITNYIEREGEMSKVIDLLARNACLTITGSGGCGKTRLALEMAAEIRNDYLHGVWFVELAALTNQARDEQVAQSITKAIGLPEEPGSTVTQTLVNYCYSRKLLLVIDNCEHVIQDSAKLIKALLHSCPGVKILATSRETLNIGEQVYRIPSLSFPNPTQPQTPETLLTYEAPRLFIERATAVKHDFAVTEQNAAAIARICHRLDGIPLALELAAARARSLTAEEIAVGLDDRFRLPNGGIRTALPRQQTLYAMIDWSYNLLSDPEKILLNRLSVFAGGWTRDAAKEIGGDTYIENSAVFEILASLVDKSLVQAETTGETTRYYMLNTIREFALDHLQTSGGETRIRSRHLTFFTDMALQANAQLHGAEQARYFDIFDQEYPNILVALQWCFGRLDDTGQQASGASLVDFDDGIKLISAMGRFFGAREPTALVRELYEAVISMAKKTPQATDAWATVFHETGGFARMQGDYDAARSHYVKGLHIRNGLGDRKGIASSLYCIGLAYYDEGHYKEAQPYFRQALELNLSLGIRRHTALCWLGIGKVAWRLGNDDEAESMLSQSLAMMRELNDAMGIAALYYSQGNFARARGRWREAYGDYLAALSIERRCGDRPRIAEILEGFAALEVEQADNVEQPDTRFAAQLYAIAAALRDDTGMPMPQKDRQQWEKNNAFLLVELGPDALSEIREDVGNGGALYLALDSCCARLRENLPGIWETTLRSIEKDETRFDQAGSSLRALVSLGQFFRLRGHSRDVQALFERAANDNTVQGELQADVFIVLANLEYDKGNADLSFVYHSLALGIALRTGSRSQIAACHRGLGDARMAEGEYTQARTHFEKSLELAEAASDLPMVAHALENLGTLLSRQGKFPLAKVFLARSVDLRREMEDEFSLASTLFNLGNLAFLMEEYPFAKQCFTEADEIDKRCNVPGAMACGMLGQIALEKGDPETAEKIFNAHVDALKDNEGRVGVAYHHLALLALSRECPDIALGWFRKALVTQKGKKTSVTLMRLLRGVGAIALMAQDADVAAVLFGAAESLSGEAARPVKRSELIEYENNMLGISTALGEEAYEAAMTSGRSLSPEEAIGYALDYNMPLPGSRTPVGH